MKILLHTEEYLPAAQACAIRMDVFASQLRQLGHHVTVIAGGNHRNKKNNAYNYEDVIYAPTLKIRKKTTILRLLSNLSFAVSSVFCAVGVGKFDVVITTSPPPLVSISGWLISKMKKAKLVYDVRDIWPDVALEMGSFSEGSIFCRVFRWITDFMYQKADLITTVSNGKVSSIRSKLKVNMQEKVKLISNGYDLRNDMKPYDASAAECYNVQNRFTCVYIGNVGMAQGLESLLEIAEKTKHADVQFLIIGNGAEKEKLEKLANERGLDQVCFCGSLPHEQVVSILNHAKISYIPLKNGNMKDSVPTKLYESLAFGVPVLLAAEGDSADILAQCALGYSVSPDNKEQIVAKFDELVDEYDNICCNRQNAMMLIREKFSRQSAVLDLEKELRNLCFAGMNEECLL